MSLANESGPAPISVSPSQSFDGSNGRWSTFSLQVGTPGQNVQVLVSTASWQTWVILDGEGCPPDILSRITDCDRQRGRLYSPSKSTTWVEKGKFDIAIEHNLGIRRSAIFGNETIKVGYPGDGGPELSNQVMGTINALEYWIGYFGVNPKPTNWTASMTNGQSSYLATLKEQRRIPSLSFGYTAGNMYRLKQVLGSLTLGGFDAARFDPNTTLSMHFAPDNSRDLVVSIQSISSTTANGSTANLLPANIKSYIDSTVAEIWLPLEACLEFEKVFNITWDENNSLYTVSEEQHSQLQAFKPSITFKVSDFEGGPSIDLVLPYDSFDLEATWPRYQDYPNRVRFFPLRRAANESQYTLGRTFLQEVYLIVNWENSSFSLSQCVFPSALGSEIVPILSEPSVKIPDSPETAANETVIGPAIGATFGILLIVFLVGIIYMRRRRRRRDTPLVAEKPDDHIQQKDTDVTGNNTLVGTVLNGHGTEQELAADNEHAVYEVVGSVPSDKVDR